MGTFFLRMTFSAAEKRNARPISLATPIRATSPLFVGSKLDRVEALVSPLAARRERWGASILPLIMPSDGKVRTSAIRHLAAHLGIGGARWLDQFALGLPITGIPSQKGVFALKKPEETALRPALLFHADEARFRERAIMSGMKNASLLWSDAPDQVEMGRLRPLLELAPSGQPDDFPRRGFNIAFRFGAEQAAKLRACDDLNRGLTSAACAALTHIQLVSWDPSHSCAAGVATRPSTGFYLKPTMRLRPNSFPSLRLTRRYHRAPSPEVG